jgi:predicted NBD/HSP70 family sugar kinase
MRKKRYCLRMPPASVRRTTIIPRVLHALLANGGRPTDLRDLAAISGASRRSITSVVGALVGQGVLARDPLRFGGGLTVLSIAAGRETVRGALVDANGACHHGVELEPDSRQLGSTREPAKPAVLLDRIREVAFRVLAAAMVDPLLVDGSGRLRVIEATIAWPTAIDRHQRAFGHVLRHADWQRDSLGAITSKVLPAALAGLGNVDQINNANAAALGACFDIARARAGEPPGAHSEMMITIRVGDGIGAGTIKLAPHSNSRLAFIDSRLIAGSGGLAGELGHLPISNSVVATVNAQRDSLAGISYGSECSCGRRGHLESLAGARALVRRLKSSGYDLDERLPVRAQIDGVLESARSGPSGDTHLAAEGLTQALEDTGRLLGRALASPILMLNPARILLSGYLARADVVRGINMEASAWSTGVTNNVLIESVSGERNGFDENDFADVRGAALAVFRRRLFRRIDDSAADPAWWSTLTVGVGEDDLADISS